MVNSGYPPPELFISHIKEKDFNIVVVPLLISGEIKQIPTVYKYGVNSMYIIFPVFWCS